MSVPNLPEKYESEAVIQPADLLALRRQAGKFLNVPPPDGMVICMRADILRRLRWRFRLKKIARTLGDIHLVRSTQGRVGVLSDFGIGAPALVAFVEEMIAWGVKRFILLSWGGALSHSLNEGNIVLVDKAIRDEGVSHHYLPTERYVHADDAFIQKVASRLSERNIKFKSGTAWTTDAPYRETQAEVKQYRSENVQIVEMETAGLYALAKARNVGAASIVIAADSLADLSWRPPVDMRRINHAFDECLRAAIDLLDGGA
jgi:uridine phosphorylase